MKRIINCVSFFTGITSSRLSYPPKTTALFSCPIPSVCPVRLPVAAKQRSKVRGNLKKDKKRKGGITATSAVSEE